MSADSTADITWPGRETGDQVIGTAVTKQGNIQELYFLLCHIIGIQEHSNIETEGLREVNTASEGVVEVIYSAIS